MKLHKKTYIILIFSKILIAKNSPKEKKELSFQIFTNFSNPISEENLKKNVKNLKNTS